MNGQYDTTTDSHTRLIPLMAPAGRHRHATTVEIPLAPGDPLVLFVPTMRLATFHVMNMHEVHGIITKVGIQYVVRSGLFA